jgi:ABC-2 type transport system permease protein
MGGFLAEQTASLATLWMLFQWVPSLSGWTLGESLLVFGFAIIPRGIAHAVFDNIWLLGPNYIIRGRLTLLLTRPLPVLFQLISERLTLEGFSETVTGIAIVSIASTRVGLVWTPYTIFLAVFFVLCGTLLYKSILLVAMSTSFWVMDGSPLATAVYEIHHFSKYPLPIYNGAINFFLTYIIPFAVTSYFPVTVLLNRATTIAGLPIVIGVPLITVIGEIVSLLFWRYALRRYEGTGT